jgi:dTDP-4-amino-4,6-dideoxygalactose transaminase
VLADVDAESWQLTPKTAWRIAEKMPIHAVMPVAVYGVPVPAAEWDQFTEDTGIPVIIDAAAALESQALPKKCLVAHSLHATKPFSVGEGGVLISRNADHIEEARCISNFGTYMRIARQDGSNAKLSEYHGAVGLAQLKRWQDVKKRRQKVFALYRTALDKAGLDITLQKDVEHSMVSTFMLQTQHHWAHDVADDFIVDGIAAHRMYLPPLYQHPHFANLIVTNGQGKSLSGAASAEEKARLMINSELMQQSVFGVPFHAFMDKQDIDCVVGKLAQAVGSPPVRKAAYAL